MTVIEINKKIYTVPTEWNELSQQQLLSVMETLFMRQYTGDEIILKLLKILTNMTWWQFKTAKIQEMEEFFYLTQFLLKEQTGLTRQLLPEYDGLYGPSGEFTNLLMEELAMSDAVFMEWTQDRERTDLLDLFCSFLYRPIKRNYDLKTNPDGDPREPFNQNLAEYRAKHQIKKWPISVKLAIVYWYDGCRWLLVENNDEVFGGSEGDVSKYGLAAVMLSVAETGALGDFTKVEKHFVHTVMMQINESIRKAKEQEKAMKQ